METTLRPDILDKLTALRRALRARLAAEGVAAVAMALVALVFVTLGLDYWLALERPARIGVLAAGLAGVAWVVWRRLGAPMGTPMTTADLALLVEDRFPQLGDRLISAVQFAAGAAGPHDSPAMIDRLVQQANELAGPLDCRPIVERRTGRRMVRLALCAVALLAGFTLWQSELMAVWLARNVAMANTPWPQDIYLKVSVPGQAGPDFIAVRGEDLKIVIEARRTSASVAFPHEVSLHVEGWDSEKVDLTDAALGQYIRTMRGVNEEFTFYVTCEGDKQDRHRPHRVRVIDPPALKEVQFVIAYPAYMVRTEPGETLTGPRSGISVPIGADVTVRATATKDIRRARMIFDAQTQSIPVDMARERVSVPGESEPRPRMLVGKFSLPAGAKTLYRGLRIVLEDTDNATNSRAASYRIDPRPDAPPDARLTSYDIGRKVTARATIPLGVTVKDDNGLTGVWVELASKSDFASPAKWPLLGGTDQPRQYANPDLSRAADPAYQPFKLDLEPLGIKPDEQPDVYVRVRASDNLPGGAFGGPNQASSDKVLTFTVAPDDVVMDILLQRQRGLRVDLVGAREEQAKAMARTEAAGTPAERANAPKLLETVARTEQVVAATCSRVADAMGEVLTEMKNNRLGNAKAYEMLARDIMDPLRAAAKEAVGVESDSQAAGAEGDEAKRKSRLAGMLAAQKRIIARLDRILDTMEQAASLQEAINRATLIRKTWQDIEDRTRRLLEEDLRGIVQPAATQPATRVGP